MTTEAEHANESATPTTETTQKPLRLKCKWCAKDLRATVLIVPGPIDAYCDPCLARVLVDDPEAPIPAAPRDPDEGRITLICRVCDKTIVKGTEQITSFITCAPCAKSAGKGA